MSGSPEQAAHNNPFDINAALDGAHKLYDQVAQEVGLGGHNGKAEAPVPTSKVQLPDLHLVDHKQSVELAAAKSASLPGTRHPDTLTEIGNVISTAADGAVKYAEKHPVQLVEDLAIGAAVGVGTGFAIGALGLGAVAASPWVIGGAAIVGVGALGYEAVSHWGEITHDTSVVGDPTGHSPQEVAQAKKSVQDFGAGALKTGVKLTGGIAGGPIGFIAGDAVNNAVVDAISALVAPTFSGAGTAVGETDLTSTGAALSTTTDTATATAVGNAKAAAATTGAGSKAAMATPDAPPETPTSADLKAARLAALEGEEIEPPFTLNQTTMTVTNQASWTADVNANGNGVFGRGILHFANGWATNMERALDAGQPMSQQLVDHAADEIEPHGVTGYMYSVAQSALYHSWKYGPELQAFFASHGG